MRYFNSANEYYYENKYEKTFILICDCIHVDGVLRF